MKNLPQISEAEFEIMKVIWDNFPISTNEITDMVMKNKDWNIRTIHTLIARLFKKGVITHTQKGRVYIYSPAINKEDYISTESKSFIDKFYNGAINKMVMNFIENDMLSNDDIKELRNILNKRD